MTDAHTLFWSYAHSDNAHDGDRLFWLCQRLTGELRMQTAMELESFWDEEGIRVAADWQAGIAGALGHATLMVAIITPSYFKSAYCRAEYEFFHNREQEEGMDMRIIPIYYVTTPELESPSDAGVSGWARDLARRQRYDWRELRLRAKTSPPVRRAIQDLAAAIKTLMPDKTRQPARLAVPEPPHVLTPDEIDYTFLQQTGTQRRIVEALYRLPRREIPLDDFYQHFSNKVDPGAINGSAEMFYRIKELVHVGLLVMKRIGIKTTIIKAAPEVGNVLFDRKRIDT